MSVETLVRKVEEFGAKTGEVIKSHGDRLAKAEALLGKVDKVLSQPIANAAGLFATARDRKEEGKWGWKSLNHFLHDVREADRDAEAASRLKERVTKAYASWSAENPDHFITKAGQGLSEAVGPDGGVLLAPTFTEGVLEIMHKEENLLEMCDKYEMAGPSLKVRAIDETSRVTGSRWGGVQGYWADEGASLTSSKPKFRLMELTPHKLTTLFYATDELMADGGPMLEQMTSRLMAKEINFLIGVAIVRGSGAGQPLGILNAAALVTVNKRVGQAPTTIIAENVLDMYSRLHLSGHASARWLVHQDTFPQLGAMTIGTAGANLVVYVPPGGLSAAPYGTLMGKPVVITEFSSTLGTVGDILLVDMKAIIAATRGAINAASSMHVAFLTDETAFRLTYRVAAQPWWHAALTPFLGSNTQSPYIALQTRN